MTRLGQRIEGKTEELRLMRQEIRDKDAEIEFLELLIKEKSSEIGKMDNELADRQKQIRPEQFFKKQGKQAQSKAFTGFVENKEPMRHDRPQTKYKEEEKQ